MGTITKVRVFWVARKNPYLTQATPKNTCHILLPQKTPESKISNPKKSFDHPCHLKSGFPHPFPPTFTSTRVLVSKWYGLCWLCLSGIVFEGTMEVYERIYHFNSKLLRKKEKYANSKWILTNLFCCSSNLSKDYFISYRAGLKRVWITIFFGLKEVRIWRTGWHTPTKNSQDNPPGLFLHKKSSYAWHTVVMQSLCHMLV